MDIGGTNVRIGRLVGTEVTDIQSWPCHEFSGPEAVINRYFKPPELVNVRLCMAIAAPVYDDRVSMVNRDWSFSIRALEHSLGLRELSVINDFLAMSLVIPDLAPHEKLQLGGGSINAEMPALVCGPGTGLGVSLLLKLNGSWHAVAGEGGHMDFAPNTEYELKIWQAFHHKYGHVSAERILSGPGLEELYRVICDIESIPASPLSAAEISTKALETNDPACTRTLQLFCAMLGSFCGSQALCSGAFGGVYIGGGIVPRFLDFFIGSEFRDRFEAKGRYRDYNEKIPTFMITTEHPGLRGAARYLLSRQR